MQDLILHYDVPEKSVDSIPTYLDITIGGQIVKLYLTMFYWRPDYQTYHLEYRQMED